MEGSAGLWNPPTIWSGQDCYIIGGGPSLTGFDFSVLKGRNVLGCNDAFRLGPEIVSYAVFGDAAFFHRHAREMQESKVLLVTCSPSLMPIQFPGLLQLQREKEGLHSGSSVGWNNSTGAMSINVAISLGATKIYLLGFDCCNQGDKSHWHRHGRMLTRAFTFDRFNTGFKMIAACLPKNVQVFNVTDGSSQLKSFPKVSFQEFRQHLAERKDELYHPAAEAKGGLLAAHAS